MPTAISHPKNVAASRNCSVHRLTVLCSDKHSSVPWTTVVMKFAMPLTAGVLTAQSPFVALFLLPCGENRSRVLRSLFLWKEWPA